MSSVPRWIPFPEEGPARIFPAIDLRGGRCVRLVCGRRDAEIDYGTEPLAVARRWVEAGAECLHVVDLGAALGEADSAEAVLAIARGAGVPVQAGGGIRDAERVARCLEDGVSRVMLGTRALRDPAFLAAQVAAYGKERIVLSIDCEGEAVRVSGWEEVSALDLRRALELARQAGVRHLLVTATDRDGTLAGPRLDLIELALAGGGFRVVAAGGIGSLADVRRVLELRHPALEGVVVGRALYEDKVDLTEAVALSREIARSGGKARG
jgi:phosphoribosylformimino-5-aminoimidazole carboxamide ribotide isomerase